MAEILDFNAARARRLAEDEAFEGLDALIEADLKAEESLPRDRLAPEALAGLRVDLIAAMSGAGARNTDRASVLHTVLYAMVRELLDQRACMRTLRGALEAYSKRAIQKIELEDELSCLVAVDLCETEVLCSLSVELGVNRG